MALVSVILPTCDRPALLPRAVESVLAQTEADFELVLVDTNRRLAPVEAQHSGARWWGDPRIRRVRATEARNAAAARNAGLAAATSEWVSYLDDDDAYRPQKLARQLALARESGAPLVLCGATFHLRGRRRRVQSDAREWRGDDLLLHARWNTPLLLHRHPGAARFDERLSPGEDAEFAHRLLAHAGAPAVPVVPEALVDIYPQTGPRVNSNPGPMRAAAARILALRPGFYTRAARRRYVLQTLLGVAKLRGDRAACVRLGWRLVRESGGQDWRAAANAFVVSLGIARDRWVS